MARFENIKELSVQPRGKSKTVTPKAFEDYEALTVAHSRTSGAGDRKECTTTLYNRRSTLSKMLDRAADIKTLLQFSPVAEHRNEKFEVAPSDVVFHASHKQ
ncbi:hypothetical protein CDAR_563411 [Caerostris darwini]|uniref:Uncharacterized protein n=1 Tax=Caerostris darwini TaxID=1538125 RepID=A0AAV4X361_9ARAC|nr:hypothetical protein CDAR_563411 [Caerostris darwini]